MSIFQKENAMENRDSIKTSTNSEAISTDIDWSSVLAAPRIVAKSDVHNIVEGGCFRYPIPDVPSTRTEPSKTPDKVTYGLPDLVIKGIPLDSGRILANSRKIWSLLNRDLLSSGKDASPEPAPSIGDARTRFFGKKAELSAEQLSLMAAQVCAPIIASGSLGSDEDRALISSALHVALSDNSFAPFMEECNRQLMLSGSQVQFTWTPEIQRGNFITTGPQQEVEFTQSYGIKLIDSGRPAEDPNRVMDRMTSTLSKRYCAKNFSDAFLGGLGCFGLEPNWRLPPCIDYINSRPKDGSDFQKYLDGTQPGVLQLRDVNRLRKSR